MNTASNPTDINALKELITKTASNRRQPRLQTEMTEFDRRLIEKASTLSKYEYGYMLKLAELTDTQKGHDAMLDLWWECKEAVEETL